MNCTLETSNVHTVFMLIIIDINECTDDIDGCEHVCVNEIGGYHCECNDGFQLDDDNHGCPGIYSEYYYSSIYISSGLLDSNTLY